MEDQVPAIFRAICWQSLICGEPPEDWFTKVESPQSLTDLRASSIGAAWMTAGKVARMERTWSCILLEVVESCL
jgi:hypothetical protein